MPRERACDELDTRGSEILDWLATKRRVTVASAVPATTASAPEPRIAAPTEPAEPR
jgi:hypothetical protein